MTKIVLLALLVCACGSSPTRIDPNSNLQKDSKFAARLDFENLDLPRLNEAVFLATNEARLSNKRTKVAFHPKLAKAAVRYAKRQAKRKFLAHEDPTGGPKKPNNRVIAAGGVNPFIAENLATTSAYPIASGEKVYVQQNGAFTRTPDGEPLKPHTYRSYAREVVQQWLDSPGHRRNLLSKEALEVGCGVHLFYQGEMPSFVAVQKFQLYEPLE